MEHGFKPERVKKLEEAIIEDFRHLKVARQAGNLALAIEWEDSMNDRLDDLSERMPNIVRGEE